MIWVLTGIIGFVVTSLVTFTIGFMAGCNYKTDKIQSRYHRNVTTSADVVNIFGGNLKGNK